LTKKWTEENGLTLPPDKIHVGDCLVKEEGFDFLGYHFEVGKRTVRKKSRKKLNDKIRELTKRSSGESLAKIIF
jgi:RNA-directed DNA polymerase